MQVYIRVRPDLPAIDGPCEGAPHLLLDEAANTIQVPDVDGPAKAYKCHRVFGTESTTEEVYADVFREPMDQMARGFNVTLFAYGQTGSGKTHTMSGSGHSTQGGQVSEGITSMAFQHIFDNIKKSPTMAFNISVSVMEIYQDVIYDLLVRPAPGPNRSRASQVLRHCTLTGGLFCGLDQLRARGQRSTSRGAAGGSDSPTCMSAQCTRPRRPRG